MRVFLIHGMGRSRASMAALGLRLRAAGHAPSNFGYQVMGTPLDRIARDFVAHVRRVQAAQAGGSAAGYAVVGHSLGNIITRMVVAELPPGFERFVMLAPPNRSPALARASRKSRIYRSLTGEAGKLLGDREFYAQLPIPELPTLILAGGSNPAWLPHNDPESDGIVSIEETRLAGAEHRVVDATHTFIMNHPEAVRQVLAFLER
ncbi:MAG: lysophospholipase [Myxococcales bacterium]|nr:lysophospholipase [Myxococcales bacterium]